MKKSFVIVFVALFSTTLFARFEVSNVALQWSAFKTPKKIAVKGTFKDMKLESHSTQSLNSSLIGTSLTIDTRSVSSGNEGRDIKLVHSYFDLFSNPTIKATIVKVTPKSIVMALQMNDKRANIIMDYHFINETTMQLEGSMDMLKFALGDALKSINEACFDLHKGKTWADVTLKVIFNING